MPALPGMEPPLGKVKIKDVKTCSVNIKYPANLVKITTDSGLYGIGEAYNRSGILDHIEAIKEQVIGEDPLNVGLLYGKMMESFIGQGSWTGSLPGAISGIESALWDLAGKILNVPVCILLGGKFRDKVLVYHDTGSPATTDPAAWVEEAIRSREYGFKAMKFDLNPRRGERWNRTLQSADMREWMKILEAIRAELGPDFPLGIDLHWKYNTRDALIFTQMTEALNLWFMEDPIPPQNAESLKRITEATRVPIVTGENLFTRHSWRPFIEIQACDAIQPDPQKCGGLMETKWIADWAAMFNMPMFAHNMCTPVGTMASAHVCAAVQTFVSLESDSVELPYWQDIILRDGPIYKEGYLEIPDKPGLGIELNEDVCRANLVEGSGFFE
jgi:L-alanine-DL-glutamate epimerase-like enolase superfamily enzyme